MKPDLIERLKSEAHLQSSHYREYAGELLSEASKEIERLREALGEILRLEPGERALPEDWSAQVDACPECQRYKGHPIQAGICDTHRRPLWARSEHRADEEARIGPRAKSIALAALQPILPSGGDAHGSRA